MASKGRRTGVKIERKPKSFYYLDGQGRVMEKPAGRGGTPKFTGKRVPVNKDKFRFVDGQGHVCEVDRKTGGGGRKKKSDRSEELLDEILGGR